MNRNTTKSWYQPSSLAKCIFLMKVKYVSPTVPGNRNKVSAKTRVREYSNPLVVLSVSTKFLATDPKVSFYISG